MDVYFIRHGQTNGNLGKRHQHPDTQLNEEGVRQVQKAAKRVVRLNPTHIITSEQLRALETAELLGEACDLVPDTHHAFEELGRPLSMVGSRYLGLTTLTYVFRWFFGFDLGEGESYEGFVKRIKKAQEYLETLPEESRVVVVSHSVFMNIFIEHLCLFGKMSFWQATKSFIGIFTLRNAEIVHLRYQVGNKVCSWRVISR